MSLKKEIDLLSKDYAQQLVRHHNLRKLMYSFEFPENLLDTLIESLTEPKSVKSFSQPFVDFTKPERFLLDESFKSEFQKEMKTGVLKKRTKALLESFD